MRRGSIHSAGQAIADVVLSMGHASMLLYSLLHLAEVRAVNKDYETLGEVSVPLDSIKAFRAVGQPLSWASGVPLDVGRGDHHGAARPRRRLGMATPSNGWQRDTTVQASKICSTSTSTRFAEMDA
jgi:hypothetical protein